jgi:ZIP family zinc transporter
VDPVLILLACSALAAITAPLGVLPLKSPGATPLRWIGWANALAAGFMLGNGVVLAEAGLEYPPILGAAGALLGIVFVYWTHFVSGTVDLDLNQLQQTEPDYGYKILLVGTLHSASEGIAMGVAMLYSVPLGIAVALTLAIHNVPEGTILGAVLTAKGVSRRHAAGWAAATNSGQVFLAVTTYAVLQAMPAATPIAVGFAVGTLVYLSMSELLPQSYRQAGATGIALVASIAMGIVVLLGGRGL